MPRLVPTKVSPEIQASIDEAIASAVATNRSNMDRVISDAARAAAMLNADLALVTDPAMRQSLLTLGKR